MSVYGDGDSQSSNWGDLLSLGEEVELSAGSDDSSSSVASSSSTCNDGPDNLASCFNETVCSINADDNHYDDNDEEAEEAHRKNII
jgi:hypothetical protein